MGIAERSASLSRRFGSSFDLLVWMMRICRSPCSDKLTARLSLFKPIPDFALIHSRLAHSSQQVPSSSSLADLVPRCSSTPSRLFMDEAGRSLGVQVDDAQVGTGEFVLFSVVRCSKLHLYPFCLSCKALESAAKVCGRL